MIETIMYKCDCCGESFNKKMLALECEFNHAKERLANQCLQDGYNLEFINHICNFGWNLSEEMKKVNKDSCFKIDYLQCCNKPAYQITNINYRGDLYLWGIGSWSGGYGEWKTYNDYNLQKVYPKEKLFVYGED